jgi:hypothetical protein
VYIGAILTVAGRPRESDTSGGLPRKRFGSYETTASQLLLGRPVANWDLLGKSVLERTVQRLRVLGIDHVSIIAEDTSHEEDAWPKTPLQGKDPRIVFWSTWDRVVSQYLNWGMETLLLARLGPYLELDVADLLRFHHENHSQLTQVYRSENALDLVVVDAAELRQATGTIRGRLSALLPNRQRYMFSGYFNPLTHARDFRRLVRESLLGRCAIRPVGEESAPSIWIGEGARVERSAKIFPPVFIGQNSYVGASCTISGASVIERDCEIDCGTIVEDSCIFPATYVGMGLSVRQSLLAPSKMFHLGRDVEVQMRDPRLIGSVRGRHHFARAARSVGSVLSTRTSQMASLIMPRRFGRPG